jgi:hypothetical protein
MQTPPAIPPALEDVANTARFLQSLAQQVDSGQFDAPSLAATLRQLARDLERDDAALRKAQPGGTA